MYTHFCNILKCIALILVGLNNTLYAQYENDVWFFGGGSAGMSYSHTLKKFLPYSGHQPLGGEGCAVATDPTTGDMMFYTDGNTVYTRDHTIMQGGNDLGGHPSSAQAVAIVPVPGDCGRYYVFSNSKGGTSAIGEVYFSIVDMTANSGDGAVINSKNLLRSDILEGMIAISKPNSNDFWLVGSDNQPGSTFYVFEITASSGISGPQLFDVGSGAYRYCLSYSEKAGKIAASYPSGSSVYVFDFNAISGTISNEKLIDDNFPAAYSSEWSPDGTKLYYSTWNDGASLRQYDFDNAQSPITDILMAPQILDSLDGGGLKMGPDGKIYFIHARGSTFLSCILYPDSPGLACGYQTDYINLGNEVKGLNLPATLTPVWAPDNCQRPAWRARVTSINAYEEAPELLRDVVQNGIAYIPKSLSGKDYYWTQFNARLPRAVQVSGAISIECRLRNSKSRGGIDAYDVGIWLHDGNKSGEVFYMGNPAAVSYTQIRFGEIVQTNIPNLVTDFEDWRTLKLEIIPNLLKTYVDGQFQYELPYEGAFCRLSQFGVSFKGSGDLDWVKLYDGSGNLIYSEDFLSPCEFACFDAEPAQDEYINRYAAVEAVCGNRFTVSHPENFNPGDQVLLIQMQGAVASKSDIPEDAGKVLDYGNAGNYELNVVEKIDGENIYLKNKRLREYDVAGKVQLVYVPDLGDGVLGCVSCPPWDGSIGGVLAFTGNKITLEGDVDVSGKGFPGGVFFNEQTDIRDIVGLYYPADVTPNYAAFKGSGISETSDDIIRGCAPQANAGGGGDAHNRGGGAGANAGSGGNGGEYTGNLATNAGEGMGGHPLRYDNLFNRVFMGGGGGAGHTNNGRGSRGGNGGGIIIALTQNLQYRGGSFRANGEHPPEHPTWPANIDGGGGGGGGGAILLDVSETIDPKIVFEAKGGSGTSVEYRHGHGGGGGGGILWVNKWQGGQALLTGGSPGIGADGNNNGAEPGVNGFVLTGLKIPHSKEPYEFLKINGIEIQPDCAGTATVTILAAGAEQPLRYYDPSGASWQPTGIFPKWPGGFALFRIVDGCDEVADSNYFVQVYPPLGATVTQEPQRCDTLGQIIVKPSLGKPPYRYWQNDVPWANGAMRGLIGGINYDILVRDALGCEILLPVWLNDLSETVDVNVNPPDTTIVKGQSVALSGTATTSYTSSYQYSWIPTYWLTGDSSTNAVASPDISTTYTLRVSDYWGCTGEATVAISVVSPKVYIPNVFNPEGSVVENRYFTVMSAEGVAQIKRLAVFDRWGALVFEQRDIQPGDFSVAWDGVFRGQLMSPGIYIYITEVEYLDGSQDVITGDVLLVR